MLGFLRRQISVAAPWMNRDEVRAPHEIMNDAPLGLLTYEPLPLEQGRNDVYSQAYTWPKAQSDRFKWYNNTFWGNRLPPATVGIGIPGYNAVPQKLWVTQYSPETTMAMKFQLQGGAYPYGMSVMQAASIMQQQQAAWTAQAGHGV